MAQIKDNQTETSTHSIWAVGMLLVYSMMFAQFYIVYVNLMKDLNTNILLLCVAVDIFLIIDTVKVVVKDEAEGKVIHTNKNYVYRSAILCIIVMYFALTINQWVV